MKVGDMVVLIRVQPGSTGERAGMRVGMIGTITKTCGCPHHTDWAVRREVSFPNIHQPVWGSLTCCPVSALRLIPPPERADEDFNWRDLCRPKSKELQT